jgi:hypothetical protein
MSMTTFSAQVPDDSGLADDFEEFRREKGMNKSEAVRALMRQSLERELNDDVQPDQRDRDEFNQTKTSADWIDGNEGILMGLAFLIGSDGILNSLQSIAGDTFGSVLYASLGAIIIAAMIPMFVRHVRQLLDRDDDEPDHAGPVGAD